MTPDSLDYDFTGVCRELAADMLKSMRPSVEFDARIQCLVNRWPVPGNPHWPMLAQAQGAKPYSFDLGTAVGLIPAGWWWHMSHLEVEVMPTSPHPDIPISNSMDYRFSGRPVAYSCTVFGARDALPIALCIAVVTAWLGLSLKAKAKAEKRMYLVQTGQGPMIADADGRLLEMPSRSWLSDDGVLIAHKDAFPQYAFLEPEPDEED